MENEADQLTYDSLKEMFIFLESDGAVYIQKNTRGIIRSIRSYYDSESVSVKQAQVIRATYAQALKNQQTGTKYL